jgi:endonuclease/exonuclease/phosphatase family metal-dependent hydrolase
MASLKKSPAKKTVKSTKDIQSRNNVVTSENDHLSIGMQDLVPDKFKGTDRYLDIVQWNIEWFGAKKSTAKDKGRIKLVTDILADFNADLFVFQEVAGPSGRYPGVLDEVADELTRRDAGDYVVYYTQAGGEQRVAMMWDRDWIRSKDDVQDLFNRGEYKKEGEKDPFAGRTPLYGYFTAAIPETNTEANVRYGGGADKFDFQILGVHLKAMEDGHDQRLESAKILSNWMTKTAPEIDSDIMIMGDWNAAPNDPCWKPFQDREKSKGDVFFERINDPSDFSYLWLKNKSDKFGSRIDLAALSLSSMNQVSGKAAEIIKWKPIEDVLAQTRDIKSTAARKVLNEIKEKISDHLPAISRFYFSKK